MQFSHFIAIFCFALFLSGCVSQQLPPPTPSATVSPTSPPVISPTPIPGGGGVFVSTDKRAYYSSEQVQVSIRNNFAYQVFLGGCNQYYVVCSNSSSQCQPIYPKQCVWEGNAVKLEAGETYSGSFSASILEGGSFVINVQFNSNCREGERFSACPNNKIGQIPSVTSQPFTVFSSATSTPKPDIYYCQQDSDCVRQKTCCSCGMGVYINKAYQQEVDCGNAGACLCPIQNSVGKCVDNKCTAVAANPQ